MAGCSVLGCSNTAIARGLCDKHRKRKARHGHFGQTRPPDWGMRTSHVLYKMWHGMIRRCHDKSHQDYSNYGARGIIVVERWKDFWMFIDDMGPRPSKRHSIGRRDNDGPYSPDNCEWQTPTQQARNTRASVLTEDDAREIKRRVALGDKTGDIARALGIHYDHVRHVVIGQAFADVE